MLKVGQNIDRYVVEGKLGEGGMAAVYRVRHTTLQTAHALKVLTLTDAGVRERLVREGRMQARLAHENIVAVTDVLSIGGQPGLLMEFVEGPTLEQWLNRYRPPLSEIEIVFRAVCTGVGVAHHRGLIHRDLKPSNVLLAIADDRIVPKVADFGLARQVDVDLSRYTRTGSTMGTPGYMPPEQIRDASTVDRRGDLWSLGCILYRMACGVPAFDGDDLLELFTQVGSADYVSSRKLRPELPERIHVAIDRTIRVVLAERVGDCANLIDFLDGKRNEIDLQYGLKPRMPASDRPRSIGNSPEALGVARSIAEETTAGLPEIEHPAVTPPKGDSINLQESNGFFLSDDEPLRPPMGIRTAAERAIEKRDALNRPPSHQRNGTLGLWMFASVMLASGVALLIVLLGGIGLFYLKTPPLREATRETAPKLVQPAPVQPVSVPPAPVAVSPLPTASLPAETAAPVEAVPASTAPDKPSTGKVSYIGAESLWLEGPSGEVRDLSRVPPGRYKVFAIFPDVGAVVAHMGVTVQAGKRLSLTCVAAFAQCKETE